MELHVILAMIACDPDLMARFLVNRDFFLKLSKDSDGGRAVIARRGIEEIVREFDRRRAFAETWLCGTETWQDIPV
jgi:hypothetical protein